MSLLADARHRAGGAPGLTVFLQSRLGSESEGGLGGRDSALRIGTCGLRTHFDEVTSAILGSLLLDRPPKSKPVIPAVEL